MSASTVIEDRRPEGRRSDADAGAASSAEAAARGVLGRLAAAVLSGLLILSVAGFALVALGPHLFGYRTATMLTGSMEPGIRPGDVVVSTEIPATDLVVGDVISYHIPVEDHRVETHRVVEVLTHEDGSVAVRTKGDNNSNVDPWTATLEGDTVWKTQLVIPELGTVIRALRAPWVQDYAFWGAIVGMLALGMTMIWGKDSTDQDEQNA